MGEFSDMTRLEQLQTKAMMVLVGIQFAAIPLYLLKAVFLDPGKAIFGAVMLGLIAGMSAFVWKTAPRQASSRMVVGAGMVGFPAMLTYMMGGQAWQIDMHMTFFAALAMVTLMCDWRALVAAAGVTAVHHLGLNFILPSAVFPGGGDILRVLFHAVVVIAETAVLLWLAQAVSKALTDADQAVTEAEAANIQARQLFDADKERQAEIEQSRQTISGIANAFEQTVASVLDRLQNASSELGALADQLRTDSNATAASAGSASDQAYQTSGHVEAVASAAQELAASIAEVTRTLTTADEISVRAESEAGRADGSMKELHEAAREIEDIAKLVSDIAEQTNLLALNATIEAARAGEAGKGFAVVASEVKELANQTGKATEDIHKKINAMREAADAASSALTQIGSTIGEIRNASSSARDAFSQQSSATDEIARLAADAAQSTSRVSNEVTAVTGAAERATQAAGQFDEAAEGLRTAARHLSQELGKFRTDLDSAA
ncbi:MAG: chemotaxis protein [Oceanicaulis sp.]|jgi:methyl-accepting chemotaxis protein|uniref:methyl-accepting chemotaxis protein n=2 Tax=Oceanicaulis TaxID=153232 RepID=UPI000066D33C|nr:MULTISPECIES: methyl-accepting chemotaxis protein [unclassified Oceanicaulis]EAP88740.1 methyl-accepting chemotaxis protein McpI [Oceanicaulis alexandrii HTCC2633] [Oceanicaulis sp. HTCC2633]MBC39631.1 chemotaxis protein [Oceanicaulis sp.]MBG36584.1 chemotaxis protein [Oceanicaulis sp.]